MSLPWYLDRTKKSSSAERRFLLSPIGFTIVSARLKHDVELEFTIANILI